MPIIHKGFPDKLETKDLKNLIAEYQQEILDRKGHINTVLQYSPLIQLGLSELQGRYNKRIQCISLIISFLALVVAAVSLYVAAVVIS